MQPELLRACFREFDVFAEAVRHWDFDFIQLGPGAFRIETCQVIGRDFQLGYGRFSTRLEQRGAAPPGFRTFAVPLDPGMHLYWRGHNLDGSSLMAFPRGGELYSVSGKDFDVCNVSVREETLARMVPELEVHGVLRELERTEVFTPDPEPMSALRAALVAYLHVVDTTGAPPIDHQAREETITTLLVQSLESATNPHPRSHEPPRLDGLRRALDFVDTHERQHLLVSEIVRESGISQRSLEMAFRDRFDLGPKRYLMSRRMHGVRRELLRSSPETPVAEVARLWGFSHHSQFAANYRGWFGERPSETLARRA